MTNDDLIRRGDAIRIVKGAWARSKTPEDFYAITVTAFENILPYEQPERKGEWVETHDTSRLCSILRMRCSVCGDEWLPEFVRRYNYCPNCGAMMLGGEENNG